MLLDCASNLNNFDIMFLSLSTTINQQWQLLLYFIYFLLDNDSILLCFIVFYGVVANNKERGRQQLQHTTVSQRLSTSVAPIETSAVVNHLFISSDLCLKNR